MAYTTINDPTDYFNTVLYTGNNNARTITGLDFQPDLIWGKGRSEASDHTATDSVRGNTKVLTPNNSTSEGTTSTYVTSFNSNGFSLGNDNGMNKNNVTYAAWNWKETATAGFDIVAYTGNGSARTISHSLSAVPSMMIVKGRTKADGWFVYHDKNTLAPATDFIRLDSTDATTDNGNVWNDTAPTSSVFTIGIDNGVNENAKTYIAYLFAEKQGYSKFGSYTGNGNVNGTFIYTGFKPAFVMTKRTDSTSDWLICDSGRNVSNVVNKKLFANLSQAEESYDSFDFVSNGFKIRSSGTGHNASGGTFIYMAIAEHPFTSSTGTPVTAR
jgi:hypothetical protein